MPNTLNTVWKSASVSNYVRSVYWAFTSKYSRVRRASAAKRAQAVNINRSMERLNTLVNEIAKFLCLYFSCLFQFY